MKETKLLKSILIPTLGLSAIGTIAAVSTSCGQANPDPDPDKKQGSYVILSANENSKLTLNNHGVNNPDLQYSTDNGASWSQYSSQLDKLDINQGQTLYLKGYNPDGFSHSTSIYSYLSVTGGDVSISGNVMGLLNNGAIPGEQGDITAIPCDSCFYNLFLDSTAITSVSDDFLPAMNLTENCYRSMFNGCSSLVKAPELPARNLANWCYAYMFDGCTSLTTTAPELPATTLAESCYRSMFDDCSSLVKAPELPATTLAQDCYNDMFTSCSSLTTAPVLPATSLAGGCYYYMFLKCTYLNSIKIGYTGDCDSKYFSGWVSGVSASGTFYYNGDQQTAQDFGLPSGWATEQF